MGCWINSVPLKAPGRRGLGRKQGLFSGKTTEVIPISCYSSSLSCSYYNQHLITPTYKRKLNDQQSKHYIYFLRIYVHLFNSLIKKCHGNFIWNKILLAAVLLLAKRVVLNICEFLYWIIQIPDFRPKLLIGGATYLNTCVKKRVQRKFSYSNPRRIFNILFWKVLTMKWSEFKLWLNVTDLLRNLLWIVKASFRTFVSRWTNFFSTIFP